MFAWRGSAGPAQFAVTDRAGGTSATPYDGLNLALHVGDDPAAVRANRELLAGRLGVPLVYMEQVHGADVAVVDRPPDPDTPPPRVDALVTARRGLGLAVLVADCTPVLVVDPEAGVAGVAHAGRQGLAAGVVPALLTAMGDLGARHLHARVGPSICGRCYPVPLALREQVARALPETRTVDRHGGPALDLAAGVVSQLAPHCVDVQWLPGCPAEDPALYSYRRSGVTGRYAGVAWAT